MPSELRVGPQTLDEAADLGARLGTYKQAHLIIRKVAAMYPPELARAQVLQKDKERSAALDADELDAAAKEVSGDEAEAVEGSGSVRGDETSGRFVIFLVLLPSGRTGRAMVAYGDAFSGSQTAYEDEGEGEDAEDAPKAARRAEKPAEDDGEPFPGYDEATAAEVEEHVLDQDPPDAWLARTAAYERAHKNRKSVMNLLKG